MQLDVHAVLLADARHDVAGDPHLIGGLLGSFAEDLVFPLTLGDLGVDALDVDAGRDADVDVLLDDLSRDAADILVADAGVVRTLRSGVTARGKPSGTPSLNRKYSCSKPNQASASSGIVARVLRGVRLAAGQHHLVHDEEAVLAGAIGEERDWLEHAVRALAFSLLRRAAVEAPDGRVGKRKRGDIAVYDLGLAAETGDGCVTVEPDVFEFDSSHVWIRVWRLRARCLRWPDAYIEVRPVRPNENPAVKSTNYAIEKGILMDDWKDSADTNPCLISNR